MAETDNVYKTIRKKTDVENILKSVNIDFFTI